MTAPTPPQFPPPASPAPHSPDQLGGSYAAEPTGQRPTPDVSNASVGELLGNVTRDLSTLMRQELALAQAEIKQEATKTGRAAGSLAGAGVAAFFVVLFLSIALWAGLSNVMDSGWAGLLVAVVWAAIAAALFVTGRAKLREVNPKPERTAETLGHVPDALKGNRGGAA